MTHETPASEPPRLASKLLRACCASTQREEIAGDLFELYARRAACSGVAAARRRYWLDVLDVCVSQLRLRSSRALERGAWRGALRVYPLRIVAFLMGCAMLLALTGNDRPWAIVTLHVLLGVLGVIEILVYVVAIRGLVTRTRKMRRPRGD